MDIQDQMLRYIREALRDRKRINEITSMKDGSTRAELNELLDTLVFVSGDLRALNEASEMARQAR